MAPTPNNRLVVARVGEAREHAIAALQEHFAHDLLDVDELERRVTEAHAAESVEALTALVADLPPTAARVAEEAALVRARVAPTEVRATETIRTIMSATHRAGSWSVPRRMEVRGLMSATVLDFREASFPPGPVDLEVRGLMSAVEIIVPPGLAVSVTGGAILGTFEHVDRAPGDPAPGAPLLRVHGRVVMGTVEVRTGLVKAQRRLDRAHRDD